MAITSNMQLVLATVSETLGPEWAELINQAFQAVDLHDHSTGKGVKVTPSGLNINSELDFKDNKASNLKATGLKAQASVDLTNTGSLQRVGANLYYVTGAGSSVQITSGSSLNSPGTGELTVDAPAAYPYTVTSGDSEVVLIIDTSSARTINLPAATTAMTVVIKDGAQSAQDNNITVAPNGSDTIDGANSNYVINTNNAALWFISDGVSSWYII